ncbi:A-kinase anchor protein 11 [Thalassophryne amazonica]|uniref:A-kinase anchor protein 11 n=1 Tax=Thalassophryne amazonica TaxID=390379 RepID=UPI001471B405|nr:A-kinase anchor protein 11 [Thalassophryne amazonica]
MDACSRFRGVPLRTKATVRKETIRDSGAQWVKTIFRNKKELCSVGFDPQISDPARLTQIHFVCLPSQCEGEEVTQQVLSSLPVGLCELLRSLHVHSLKNDEVLLLKDCCRLSERKDPGPLCWLKAVCVLRHNPNTSPCPQATAASLVGLLGCYMAGIRYLLEQQVLQKVTAETSQPEEDDTNQSVSSIEDDFVTALEHLEDDDTGENLSPAAYHHFKKRDVASQTVPSHKRQKDLLDSRVILTSSSKKCSTSNRSAADVSVTVQRSSGVESQWTYCSLGARLPSPSVLLSDSEESDCSSPSPIIFLDEVGYQKSLLAKLDIPQVPGGPKERVEDSDSEVSEFFDSFDQFDDLEEISSESCTLALPLDITSTPASEKNPSESNTSVTVTKHAPVNCSTKVMNPHRFDHPTLPASVKKPTPLKPGSPYSLNSDMYDPSLPVQSPSEDSGGPLFSPVSSSAFSPLVDFGGPLEYFWKTDGNGRESSELRKPQHLCSLYKTYSDFASNLSKEILGSVCGYQSPVNIDENKNLSCVCHKKFKNPSGYLMKLSEIQETVTATKVQQTSQSLKDAIQRFAADLVEMSLGSALRDLQKGVSSCTTTLCHLAARLTSSVFQMAFHEIGMRQAYVLKERAINGLASFLVGEAVSGALKEFLTVKKQIFHNTVTRFAADLAEELVFEGIMEVCQFSYPSTPLACSNWTFAHEQEEDEEVVCSYASDLSESVLQEAFIELSQTDVAFTSQAAISVSLDNVCYVSAENSSSSTSSTFANQQVLCASSAVAVPEISENAACTVKKALFSVSGVASCIPVPHAGQALSSLKASEETCHNSCNFVDTSQISSSKSLVVVSSSGTTTFAETDIYSHGTQTSVTGEVTVSHLFPVKSSVHNFSDNMVGKIVSDACEQMTASKMKSIGDSTDSFTKTTRIQRGSFSRSGISNCDQKDCMHLKKVGSIGPIVITSGANVHLASFHPETQIQPRVGSRLGPKSSWMAETHPVLVKDTLNIPGTEADGQRSRPSTEEDSSSNLKSSGIPCTPPCTPQQPSEVSTDKQVKQFSKKLKNKLAKEFSPATPPPTPHHQAEPGPGPADISLEADKAEFMLKLMRSLSEEADDDDNEDQEELAEEAEGDFGSSDKCLETTNCRSEMSPLLPHRLRNKEAFHFAERLACHIVSMATEMDNLGVADREEEVISERRRDSVAQFSEQTLNSLWVYAGEVAGEVIHDVKRMVTSGQQCLYHRALRRRSLDSSGFKCPNQQHKQTRTLQNKACRVAEQWHNNMTATFSQSPMSTSTTISSSSSGLSSQYASCESMTDEYATYLIRVLKKEGGKRELVLDHYASHLAYRAIKLGLEQATRKIKQRSSSTHPHVSKSLRDKRKGFSYDQSSFKDGSETVVCPLWKDGICCCRNSEQHSQREYPDLVHFAESLAYNVTCDVTQKLHFSSARIPKSFTDSCLYKTSKVKDQADTLIRNSFSCPLLSKEGLRKHHRSTGSLCEGGYSSRAMQVIEHYARKIVDDTLKVSLASVGHSQEHLKIQGDDKRSHSQRLSDGAGPCQGPEERTCHLCQVQDCLHCSKFSRHRYQSAIHRRRRGQEGQARAEELTNLEIPQIHIDLDRRATFAEDMVSMAIENAKCELSNTSLNADSGISHEGTSYAESLTAEIMTSALSICHSTSISSPGKETTESTVSQQLSVGDDSLGSWSNLSFEDEHPDDNSSFLHLSDSSNGNSSSWSSLGLEGDGCEERMSFSPSDSDNTEDKELDAKEESSGTLRVDGSHIAPSKVSLVILSSDVWHLQHGPQHVTFNLQLRSMLQWVAASLAGVPQIHLSPERELQQLPAVVQRIWERKWRVGELLHTLLRYCEETQSQQASTDPHRTQLFQWLLEHI